jgi:mRNA interferase MazF
MHRGEVWDADLPGLGPHPVVIVSRDRAIPVMGSVVCVLVTSSVRGHAAEVELNADEGLDRACAANCDDLHTVRKSILRRRRGSLGPVRLRLLDNALRVALGLD